jgi:hypothetical protein
MANDLTEAVWEWAFDGEWDKVVAIYRLGDWLEPITLPALEQFSTLPDCALCELVLPFESAYDNFMAQAADRASSSFASDLSELIRLTSSELERHDTLCFDRIIFYQPQWQVIRRLAVQALVSMEWDVLASFREHFGRPI